MASVITLRFWVTYSTSSFSAARFISFHLRSLSGSCMKSNNVIHCCSFSMNKASLSEAATSEQQTQNTNAHKFHNGHYSKHGVVTHWTGPWLLPWSAVKAFRKQTFKPSTHWQQSWFQHGRLCWKSSLWPSCRIQVVGDLSPKPATKSTVSATKLTVSATVDFVAGFCNSQFCRPFTLFRQVHLHLGVGKSEYNPPFSGLRAASTWEAVDFCGSHRQTDVLAKFSSWLGGWSPFCGDNGRHTAQVWERRSLRCRHLWVGG